MPLLVFFDCGIDEIFAIRIVPDSALLKQPRGKRIWFAQQPQGKVLYTDNSAG